MVAFGGLFAALSQRASAAAPAPAPRVRNESRARSASRGPLVQPESQDNRPAKNWSRGNVHGALVRLGKAKKRIEQAASLCQFASGEKQDVARIAFSQIARGRHSASARCVCCVCTWCEL